ncbi:MAG: TraR/DksA C4-type zinc finger protein [Kiritimatiellae bacterium]|nr:TraR/DksA C4-type zinc finger protein [Kiritimatiellia bacterium]
MGGRSGGGGDHVEDARMPMTKTAAKKTPPAKRAATKSAGKPKAARPAAPAKAKAGAKQAEALKTVAAASRPAARNKAQAVSAKKPAPDAHQPAAPAGKAAQVRLSDQELAKYRQDLIAMRNRLTGKIVTMRQESLKRDDEVNPEEDGTDAFDRLFSLERAGSDQQIIYKIDEALLAIEDGTYGVCQGCNELIQKPRLAALPFVKTCVRCQSEQERGRGTPQGGAPRRFVP